MNAASSSLSRACSSNKGRLRRQGSVAFWMVGGHVLSAEALCGTVGKGGRHLSDTESLSVSLSLSPFLLCERATMPFLLLQPQIYCTDRPLTDRDDDDGRSLLLSLWHGGMFDKCKTLISFVAPAAVGRVEKKIMSKPNNAFLLNTHESRNSSSLIESKMYNRYMRFF